MEKTKLSNFVVTSRFMPGVFPSATEARVTRTHTDSKELKICSKLLSQSSALFCLCQKTLFAFFNQYFRYYSFFVLDKSAEREKRSIYLEYTNHITFFLRPK